MRAKATVKKSPKATLVIGMTTLWSYSVFNEIAMATNMQECQNQEEDSYLPDFANAGVLRLGSTVTIAPVLTKIFRRKNSIIKKFWCWLIKGRFLMWANLDLRRMAARSISQRLY